MEEKQYLMERRLVLRVLQYWRDAAAGREMPALADIDSEVLADVWAECFVVDVSRPDDPRFTSVGAGLCGPGGADHSGHALSAIPEKSLLAAACAYHGRVLSQRAPLSVGGHVAQADQRQLLYRSILLPLSDDGARINYLLGAANGRTLTED